VRRWPIAWCQWLPPRHGPCCKQIFCLVDSMLTVRHRNCLHELTDSSGTALGLGMRKSMPSAWMYVRVLTCTVHAQRCARSWVTVHYMAALCRVLLHAACSSVLVYISAWCRTLWHCNCGSCIEFWRWYWSPVLWQHAGRWLCGSSHRSS
jgi:hypothetical protein